MRLLGSARRATSARRRGQRIPPAPWRDIGEHSGLIDNCRYTVFLICSKVTPWQARRQLNGQMLRGTR